MEAEPLCPRGMTSKHGREREDMKIILGSASPRRRELLAQIGLEFDVVVSDVEEKVTSCVPCEVVEQLAHQKAEGVWRRLSVQGTVETKEGQPEEMLVIGADTIVSCDEQILGKPKNAEHAKQMLRMLQGRVHQVYTGVAVWHVLGVEVECRTFHETTMVEFCPMSEEEIAAYVATGDPLDKAGAYGIQGLCARYIRGIDGDYNNVVGLPVGRLYQEIKEWLS